MSDRTQIENEMLAALAQVRAAVAGDSEFEALFNAGTLSLQTNGQTVLSVPAPAAE
jgi:hypothetical protein